MVNIDSIDFPQEFRNELKKNFCAMKYVATTSDENRIRIMMKAKALDNVEQCRNYVTELGNIY